MPGRALAANDGADQESFVRAVIQARLDRLVAFPNNLFSDPAWDIMLGSYAAELAQVRLTLTDACIASNVPASSAYRWVATLEQQGLLDRRPDPLESRRTFVSLTEKASTAMRLYFGRLAGMPI